MDDLLLTALRIAGAFQLVVAAANLPAARALGYARNLEGRDRIFRQVFWAHAGWVVATLVLLGSLDLAFAEVLAGAHPVGTYLSAWVATLWGVRLVLQVGVYDRAFLRRHRTAHWLFTLGFLFVALVHAAAALAPFTQGGGP